MKILKIIPLKKLHIDNRFVFQYEHQSHLCDNTVIKYWEKLIKYDEMSTVKLILVGRIWEIERGWPGVKPSW